VAGECPGVIGGNGAGKTGLPSVVSTDFCGWLVDPDVLLIDEVLAACQARRS